MHSAYWLRRCLVYTFLSCFRGPPTIYLPLLEYHFIQGMTVISSVCLASKQKPVCNISSLENYMYFMLMMQHYVQTVPDNFRSCLMGSQGPVQTLD